MQAITLAARVAQLPPRAPPHAPLVARGDGRRAQQLLGSSRRRDTVGYSAQYETSDIQLQHVQINLEKSVTYDAELGGSTAKI
ncbi:hypothetical protein LshimejAT787_0905820 [Lyophyllum shimeji]|uniref:Uncharacterized protein n=1 Tax=Lyophyllum shimeji TaxID=47721 RepID=A0A9P3UQK8_LYOSH|nr:hypothetical protein LshimejAT787_0905820 [Lyophyllum shimeji]